MKPKIIQGGQHSDSRGKIKYNNHFNASEIKRIYTIENVGTNYIRAWQGHSIERRWFSAIQGSFKLKLIKVNNWENPDKNSLILEYNLNDNNLNVLCVPPGYISSINSTEKKSKLLAMSDYQLGEINDEYKFDSNYFTK